MHEMALVRSVVDIVLEQAELSGAAQITGVYLTIGEGRDVVLPLMEGLFQHLARGTVAEHAKLVVKTTPLTVKCNRCGCIFPINVFESRTWACPDCGIKKDYALNSGMEFVVDRIEAMGHRTPFVSKDAHKP